MTERCVWIRDEQGYECLIPACMGSAALGPHACTCAAPESRIERAERLADERLRTIERLRVRLSELRKRCDFFERDAARARALVREMEAAR